MSKEMMDMMKTKMMTAEECKAMEKKLMFKSEKMIKETHPK